MNKQIISTLIIISFAMFIGLVYCVMNIPTPKFLNEAQWAYTQFCISGAIVFYAILTFIKVRF